MSDARRSLTWRERLGPEWLEEHPADQWLPYVVSAYLAIGFSGTIIETAVAHGHVNWWVLVLGIVPLLMYIGGFVIRRQRASAGHGGR